MILFAVWKCAAAPVRRGRVLGGQDEELVLVVCDGAAGDPVAWHGDVMLRHFRRLCPRILLGAAANPLHAAGNGHPLDAEEGGHAAV